MQTIIDYCLWSKTQADLLRKGDFSHMDIDNLIEEIESLGRSEKRALRSHLTNVLLHLLKKKYQPQNYTRSWDLSIVNSSNEARSIIEENPSLKMYAQEIFTKAFENAVANAAAETGLEKSVFPEYCPWKIEQIVEE